MGGFELQDVVRMEWGVMAYPIRKLANCSSITYKKLPE
jgi:hypothetical protein